MMGQIIKLKKSDLFKKQLRLCAVAILLTLSGAATAQSNKLPVLQQVGVIPVQWDKKTESNFSFDQSRRLFEEAVYDSARNARRFRILNNDLVAGMWSDNKGRQELISQFELHAFLSLGSANRDETIDITARMLDPNLKTLLLETESFSSTWFLQASKSDLTEKAESLIYRIFNRIPVDVSVTSIQGQYITLSGGSDQGIAPGDSVDLIRSSIKGLHPANGSWLTFSQIPVGKAKILDAKKFSSVAQLTEQVKDNAVEVGDGAKIPAIATRVKFARMHKKNEMIDAGPSSGPIVVPPLYTHQPVADPAKTPTQKPSTPTAEDKRLAKKPATSKKEPAKPVTPNNSPAKSENNDEGDGPSLWNEVATGVISQKPIDHITVYSGPQWWSIKSKQASSAGKFPVWILNNLGAQISRTLLFKIKTDFGGGVIFGDTPHSNYVGYTSFGSMYWEDDLVFGNGFIKKWRGGGYASFSGVSVSKGPYGGGDWVRGGGFFGFSGTFPLFAGETYDWFADYAIMPLNIGRLGFGGKRLNVESSFGMKLSFGAFQAQQTGVLLYGGAIELGNERMTLNNGSRPAAQDWAIKFMARYTL